jgi:hypothetical protein
LGASLFFVLVPMLTKLQAINEILTSVGETPALTLVTGAADTTAAETVLDAETRKVLAKGWHFNTDEDFEIVPDVNGRLAVPADALSIDNTEETRSKYDLVERSGFLYDKTTHSNVIGAAVKCRIVRDVAFADIPFHIQRVIVAQATRKYQQSYIGSAALDTAATNELVQAVGASEDTEADSDDYNILDNPLVYGRHWRRRYFGVI